MADNKMLIDATHPEETRVVVLRSGRVEEFDYESAARKLLRGNIYLAKVTRVEPALQAAFVDYGGNRHGFLAFNEVHPDYYQIPIADRQALIDEEAEAEALAEAEVDAYAERAANKRPRRKRGRSGGRRGQAPSQETSAETSTPEASEDNIIDANVEAVASDVPNTGGDAAADETTNIIALSADNDDVLKGDLVNTTEGDDAGSSDQETLAEDVSAEAEDASSETADEAEINTASATDEAEAVDPAAATDEELPPEAFEGADLAEENAIEVFADEYPDNVETSEGDDTDGSDETQALADDASDKVGDIDPDCDADPAADEDANEDDAVEDVGTSEDALEELPSRPRRSRRSYKIQEVIKRRQIILIQVVKEERGNKGAALTTYLSLAGRYTVLMPNTARGGGISRKITNPQDRKRLKAIAHDLEVPEGMGLIIRTAGASRTKQEIRRDFEYLLRLWESVRDMTLESTAPVLVYEEGNLIKRSIRDLYNKDIDEVVVAGGESYREAKSFMRMLMPSHAKNVTNYNQSQPLFTRFQIERQLNAMFSPIVSLRSGGYLVINQTEALVAVDVNSGKSTREFSIEETALNTNLEAAEETARQLRLRDLAGLIVIDFIDMDERRNNRAVERRMKDALRNDRARIQVGRISHFGLLEMSRQRLRTGVLEGSTTSCPHCQGTGIVRSTESVALAVIRALEDAVMSGGRASLTAKTTPTVALYILNNKRAFINDMQARHGFPIMVEGSDNVQGANFTVEKSNVPAHHVSNGMTSNSAVNMDWGFDEANDDAGSPSQEREARSDDGEENADERPRRRRRRGRRGRGGRNANASSNNNIDDTEADLESASSDEQAAGSSENDDLDEAREDDAQPRRRRRRGRRGGRRARERQLTSDDGNNGEPINDGENGEASAQSGNADVPGLGPQPGLDVSAIASNETESANGDAQISASTEEKPKRRARPRRRSPRRTKTESSQQNDESRSDSSDDNSPVMIPANALVASAMKTIVEPTPAAAAAQSEPTGQAEASEKRARPSHRSTSKSRDSGDIAKAKPTTSSAPDVAKAAPSESSTSSVAAEESNREPKRGWWQRRILGDG